MLRRCVPILLLPIFLLTACGGIVSAAGQPRVLPLDCRVNAGESIALSLDGVLPQNASIRWEASGGSIVSTGQGLNSVFTAPNTSADVTVLAYISSGTPGSSSEPVIRSCSISAPTFTPGGAPSTVAPLASTSTPGGQTVVISEVMGNPCGGDEYRKWNDYVELYNYGDQPQDVGGWWLTVNGPDNKSDMIVAWRTRNTNISLNQPVVTDTTVIPAHRFAVVLSPTYTKALEPHRMPYRFPQGTLILTIAEGDRIGHRIYGIIGHNGGRDTVVLYLGGAKSILEVISTYGSPLLGSYPQDIRDDRADNIPLDLHACSSAERVSPLGPDVFENWREVSNGSPGEAPYP
jgi:hypothetical protein